MEPVIKQFNGLMSEVSESTITFKGGLENDYYLLTPDLSTKGYLYLEASAGKFQKEGKRSPLNISLVIDRSGSMAGDKIRYVKKAAQFVVDNLTTDDFLSIVIYDDEVEVLLKSEKVTDKVKIKSLIDKITDDGSTNLSGGMLEGYAQVRSTFQNNFINRVLVLSDGLANVGILEPEKIQQIAKNMNLEFGITLSAFGVGADFNEVLMTNLADYGSGNYYFIETPDKIPSIFDKELKGLLAVVAQNAKLEVSLPEGVSLDKVFAYQYDLNDGKIVVNFRDVFSEEAKAVLIRYSIHSSTSSILNFTSKLTYIDAISSSFSEKSLLLAIKQLPTSDTRVLNANFTKKVAEQITLFESNELLEEAMREVDKGNYEGAKKIVGLNNAYLDAQLLSMPDSKELNYQASINMDYLNKVQSVNEMEMEEIKIMQKSSRLSNFDVRKKK